VAGRPSAGKLGSAEWFSPTGEIHKSGVARRNVTTLVGNKTPVSFILANSYNSNCCIQPFPFPRINLCEKMRVEFEEDSK